MHVSVLKCKQTQRDFELKVAAKVDSVSQIHVMLSVRKFRSVHASAYTILLSRAGVHCKRNVLLL